MPSSRTPSASVSLPVSVSASDTISVTAVSVSVSAAIATGAAIMAVAQISDKKNVMERFIINFLLFYNNCPDVFENIPGS